MKGNESGGFRCTLMNIAGRVSCAYWSDPTNVSSPDGLRPRIEAPALRLPKFPGYHRLLAYAFSWSVNTERFCNRQPGALVQKLRVQLSPRVIQISTLALSQSRGKILFKRLAGRFLDPISCEFHNILFLASLTREQ